MPISNLPSALGMLLCTDFRCGDAFEKSHQADILASEEQQINVLLARTCYVFTEEEWLDYARAQAFFFF